VSFSFSDPIGCRPDHFGCARRVSIHSLIGIELIIHPILRKARTGQNRRIGEKMWVCWAK
jgi:hypothetical protein